MMEHTVDFAVLSAQFDGVLQSIRRWRRVTRVLTVVVYTAVLVWFVYALAGVFIFTGEQADGGGPWQLILVIFAVFVVVNFALSYCRITLNAKELQATRAIIGSLFADARYFPSTFIDSRILSDSRLFNLSEAGGDGAVTASCYGRIELPLGRSKLKCYDVGVTERTSEALMYGNFVTGYLMVLYKYLLKPIIGARVESSMHGFRGLFCCCEVAWRFPGDVIIVPDHLESKIGYLAKNIQRLTTQCGARLVNLEDVDFERRFAVYADDEVAARRVLTPAMMRRLTELREATGRDIMLSFVGQTFYFASEMASGVFTPEAGDSGSEASLRRMYANVDFCRDVVGQLVVDE